MEINIYLDDLRLCPDNFILAKNVDELKLLFKKNKVNILSLDHDLGVDKEGNLLETGYDFVKYFCEHGLRCRKIYMHTDNVVGRLNMVQTLLAAQKRGLIDEGIEIYHYPITVNMYK